MKRHAKITYMGRRKPYTDRYLVCMPGAIQFWRRLVKGYGLKRGRILAFSIDFLNSSSLKHSRTTVRVCEKLFCALFAHNVASWTCVFDTSLMFYG